MLDVDLLGLSSRNPDHIEMLHRLTREGITKSALSDYHEQVQATNKFVLAAIVQDDSVLAVIRREIRRINPGVRIEDDELLNLLRQDVLKRDVLEGERADEARTKVRRAGSRTLRVSKPDEDRPQPTQRAA